jgi:hypothetical protein
MTNTNAKVKEDSVRQLLALLDEVAASTIDETFDFLPLSALHSQGALARLEVAERKIFGMSLNTCKKVADDFLDGGFGRLDEARRIALEQLEHRRRHAAKSARLTKVAMEEQLSDANRRAQLLREDLAHYSRALHFAIGRMRDYASAQPVLQSRLTSDLREIYARTSPARTAIRPVRPE